MASLDMDTRRLRYFSRIVELGSLGRAARDMNVAQPALSQHLAALETDFGVKLLERSHQGTTPTVAGLELYRHAQFILRQVQQAQLAVASSAAGISGRVVFGMPPAAAASPIPIALLAAAKEQYPGIDISIVEGMSGTIHDQLANGRLDLAILYMGGPSKAIECRPLYSEHLSLLVPEVLAADMPEAGIFDLSDVTTSDLIMPSPDHELRQLIDQHLIRCGLMPRCAYEVDSLQVARSLLANGAGRALLSSGTAHVLAREMPCRIYPIRPRFAVTLAGCVLAGAPLSESTKVMVRLLEKAVVELVESGNWLGVTLVGAEA